MFKGLKNIPELKHWASTYGAVTVDRLLSSYGLELTNETFELAKQKDSIYHYLLELPFENIFTDLILEQVKEYQLYAQKLFIDYSLGDEGTTDPESPGALTRERLAEQQDELIQINEDFSELQFKHKQIIQKSQRKLKEKALEWVNAPWNRSQKALVSSELQPLHDDIEALKVETLAFRKRLYTFILAVSEELKHLPGYKMDLEQQRANLEALNFDSHLGD